MVTLQKRLDKMRNNPRDWRIEDLQAIARVLGIEYRSSGGSHVVFRSSCGIHLTIPARRPIKPIYIGQFLELIDGMKEGDGDETDSEEQV